MTYEMTISGESRAKVRSPGTVALLLVITLGLYGIYWWYEINREMRDVGRARGADGLGDNPGLSAAAFFLGPCLVVPYVWTVITTIRRVGRARALLAPNHRAPLAVAAFLFLLALAAAVPVLYLGVGGGTALMSLLGSGLLEIGAVIYVQSVLNAMWRGLGEAAEPAGETGAIEGVA